MKPSYIKFKKTMLALL